MVPSFAQSSKLANWESPQIFYYLPFTYNGRSPGPINSISEITQIPLFLCIPTATILVIFYQMDYSCNFLTDFHTSNCILSKFIVHTAKRMPKGIKEVCKTSILYSNKISMNERSNKTWVKEKITYENNVEPEIISNTYSFLLGLWDCLSASYVLLHSVTDTLMRIDKETKRLTCPRSLD